MAILVLCVASCGAPDLAGAHETATPSAASEASVAAATATSPVEDEEDDGPAEATPSDLGRLDGIRLATREEEAETRQLLMAAAEARRREGIAIARPLSRREIVEAEAQLPWLTAYAPLCRRARRMGDVGRRVELAARGRRIARGVVDGGEDNGGLVIDAEHPGHPLIHVRARVRVSLVESSTYPMHVDLYVGERSLTTFPDIARLYPDHPLVQLATTARDGDCVLVTGHVLGAYTTGHPAYDTLAVPCGLSFWTRIDRLEACGDSETEPGRSGT